MSAPCETVAYSWFVFSLLLSTSILCTAAPQASSETATLVNFFKATSGTRWLNNSGWGIIDTPAAPCDWAGISCDDTGAVVQLVLSNNNLSGSLPDVLNLTNIQVFDVDSNPMLSGTLPSSLGDLVHLHSLWLDDCNFIGTIPSSLGNLWRLQILTLNGNNLTGTVPASLVNLVNLGALWLSDNDLSGTLPSSLGSLSSLSELLLNDNRLEGTLPSSLAALAPTLHDFSIANNQLSGPLPNWLANFTSLWDLDVSANLFTGTLPQFTSNFTVFNISGNQLTGTVPSHLSAELVECGFRGRFASFDITHNDLDALDGLVTACKQAHTNCNLTSCEVLPQG